MTQPRRALCHTRALQAIANRLSWGRVAHISRRTESTVRKWSNPAAEDREIPLAIALALDIAFIQAGHAGEIAPFEGWYRARLQIARLAVQAADQPSPEKVAIAAREGGEAIAAQLLALRPGATWRERRIAQQETEQAIAALVATLSPSIEVKP